MEKKGILDWLRAHTSFLKPMHRYDGELTLLEEELVFEGEDTETGGDFTERIAKSEITDIFLSFDEYFRQSDDRSSGLTFRSL